MGLSVSSALVALWMAWAWAAPARVVVMEGPEPLSDGAVAELQRSVRSRIDRPDAAFVPEVDLYQAGRRRADQPPLASVPDAVLPALREVASSHLRLAYDSMGQADWAQRAESLRARVSDAWFVDRPEVRDALIVLYAAIGYAAENTNQGAPPFYDQIADRTVNYHWYLAASLGLDDPSLFDAIDQPEVRAAIEQYRSDIQAGVYRMLQLSFDDRRGGFDPEGFAAQFEVLINGVPTPVEDPGGILEVPLGQVDVVLRRIDGGVGLSERIEVGQFAEQVYFVRQNAWKAIGGDVRTQLLAHPHECAPDLSADTRTDLDLYAQLHAGAEVYLAVAGAGAPQVWRWEPSRRELALVHTETEPFPVRFSLIASTGLATSSYALQPFDASSIGTEVNRTQLLLALLPRTSAAVDGVPVGLQLRGHFEHLLVGAGVQVTVGEAGGDSFVDLYPTAEGVTARNRDGTVALERQGLQRQVYLLGGAVLGPAAQSGYGPRGYLRVGLADVPRAVTVSGHGGVTLRVADLPGTRHALVADADGYAGMMAALPGSLYVGIPLVAFGVTAGMGVTF